jgi:hypothetical protein
MRASCRCATTASSRCTRRSVQSVHVAPARRPATPERHSAYRPLEARQLPAGLACVRAVRGVLIGGLVAALSEGGFAADRFVFSLPSAVIAFAGRERLRATGSAGETTQRRTRSGLKHATDPEPDDTACPPTRIGRRPATRRPARDPSADCTCSGGHSRGSWRLRGGRGQSRWRDAEIQPARQDQTVDEGTERQLRVIRKVIAATEAAASKNASKGS